MLILNNLSVVQCSITGMQLKLAELAGIINEAIRSQKIAMRQRSTGSFMWCLGFQFTVNMESVPELYCTAADVLKGMKDRKGSLFSIVNTFNLRPREAKAVFAVAQNTVKNVKTIQQVISKCESWLKLPVDRFLQEILFGELLFGQGFRGKAGSLPEDSPICTLLQSKDEVKKILQDVQPTTTGSKKKEGKNELTVAYLRINYIKTSPAEVSDEILKMGYSILDTTDQIGSFEDVANQLKPKECLWDYNFPEELLVFRSDDKRKITNSKLYQHGKASLLAVEILNPQKGTTILDVCAAPGTKTAALASRTNNESKIISVDKDKGRCTEMSKLMKTLGIENHSITCEDFLSDNFKIDSDIDALLLDPSCSGSGMVNRLSYEKETEDTGRCLKLAAFQTKMLCKAMALKPKKIVYSTCSLSTLENELVIKSAFIESPDSKNYKLANALPDWPVRGKPVNQHAKKCIRSDTSCLTKGFFAAVFKRIRH